MELYHPAWRLGQLVEWNATVSSPAPRSDDDAFAAELEQLLRESELEAQAVVTLTWPSGETVQFVNRAVAQLSGDPTTVHINWGNGTDATWHVTPPKKRIRTTTKKTRKLKESAADTLAIPPLISPCNPPIISPLAVTLANQNATTYRDACLFERLDAWPSITRLPKHASILVHAVTAQGVRGEMVASLRANGLYEEATKVRSVSSSQLPTMLTLLRNKPMLMVGSVTESVRRNQGGLLHRSGVYARVRSQDTLHPHANNVVVYVLVPDCVSDKPACLGVGYTFGSLLFNAPPPSSRRVYIYDDASKDYMNDVIAPVILLSTFNDISLDLEYIPVTEERGVMRPFVDDPAEAYRALVASRDGHLGSPESCRVLVVERMLTHPTGGLAAPLMSILRGEDVGLVAQDTMPCSEYVQNCCYTNE